MILTKALLHTTDVYIKKLKEAGIETTKDFLEHFPRALENRSNVLESFTYVNLKEKNTLKATIESIVTERTRSGKQMTKVIIKDANGYLSEAVYFTKPYFLAKFKSGDQIMLHGKPKYDYGKLSFPSPEIEHLSGDVASFVPVYSDLNYIPGSWFADKMVHLRPYISEIEEVLPTNARKKKGFPFRGTSFERIHFPSSTQEFDQARAALAYEELFMIQYR